jgi:uncharacterized protein (TIGR03118 family)
MNPFPFARRLAVIAAACTVTACGGADDDRAPTAAAGTAATDGTTIDAALKAQVDARLSAVASALAADGIAVDDATSNEAPSSASQRQQANKRKGRFPGVSQVNLVANRAEYEPQIVEPDLVNPWGIAIRPAGSGGHWWLGASGTGKSIQYVGDVAGTPLFQDELKIVHTGGPVTGVSFNHGTQFEITQPHANGPITAPTKFFFANLSGTVTGWTERARAGGGFDHPADSVVVVDGTAKRSAFFGVTVTPDAQRMLAADFGAQPDVRIYDGRFAEVGTLANPFRRDEPGPFEAFNVQTIDQRVFAMYGRHVPPGTTPLPAEGRLAEFDNLGKVIAAWHGRGKLFYPWGVAKAPDNFGLYSGCLLVGNFGDGTIVAFHPTWRVALDYVRDQHGRRVVNEGLWGLQFGNGASLGESNHLYLAAGVNQEKDGLFAKLVANPDTPPKLQQLSLCR